jgi:polysaccharide pyruvyl transferase WcaK-like protein
MKILVIGWHGMRNTGDDAMAVVLHHELTRLGHSVRFFAASSRLPCTGQSLRLKGFPLLVMLSDRISQLFLKHVMLDYDVLLFGGGSVFHSENSIFWKSGLVRRFKERSRGRKLCGALGVSLGPFKTGQAQENCRALLNEFDFLALRDRESFDLAVGMGLHYKPALAFDPALLFFDAFRVSREEALKKKKADQNLVGFALSDHRILGRDKDARSRIADAINRLLEANPQVRIKLFCFGKNKIHHDDIKFNKAILEKIKQKKRINIEGYKRNTADMMDELCRCAWMVSMKLHGAVFAYTADVNLVLLDYHPKCRSFACEIQLPSDFIFNYSDFDPAELSAKVLSCLNSSGLNWKTPFQDLYKRSLLNFAYFQGSVN